MKPIAKTKRQKSQGEEPEKRERYVISILPSVKIKAHSKAIREKKGFSEVIEALLYDYAE